MKEGTEMSELFQQPAPQPNTMQPESEEQGPDCQREVYQVAYERFRQSPDWVTFFREFLGVDGVVRKTFQHPKDLNAFEQGDTYTEIQQMVAKLRERSKNQTESNEPTRVITVRLPKSLHESLRAEAHDRRTSMNQLCISKLLQVIDNELVPSD
jgi:predicted HicB family RNase H-like nuclease